MDIVVREHSVCETTITLPEETANDPRNIQRLIAQRLVIKHLREEGYVLAQPLRVGAQHVRGRTYLVSARVTGRQSVGERLRAARQERGLTQEEVAKRVPCAQSYLSKVEQGQVNNPDPAILKMIEKAIVSSNGNGHH